jgi:hypothetical protein
MLLEEIIPRSTPFEDFEVEHRHSHGGQKRPRLNGRRVSASEKRPALILLTIEEIG